jgi:hypothetical protein
MSAKSSSGIAAWIQGFGQRYQADRAQEQIVRQATDMIVKVSDPGIRQIGRYRKILRSPVAGAMEYCTSLVDSLPGPVRLSRQQYHADPLVKAIFTSADELEEVLRIVPENRDLPDHEKGRDFIALLTMAKTEKTIFRHQQQGDVILRDVKSRTVNFSDHRLVAPSSTMDNSKELLRHRALEVLATIAMERIASFRGNLAEMRERREHLKSMRRIFGGRKHTQELFAGPDRDTAEKLRKVKKLLTEIEAEIETARQEFETPEDALALIQKIMNQPEDALITRDQTMRVDWMNVLVDGNDAEGNEISLAELSVTDELQRSAVLVEFSLPNFETN